MISPLPSDAFTQGSRNADRASPRNVRGRPTMALLLVATCVLTSCGDGGGCDPTEPMCGGPGATTIADVRVMSPVDTVMAVGRTAEWTAEATDAAGAPVPTSFVWSSTDDAAAAVDSDGLVSATGVGTTTIGATADGVTGTLRLRAVDADLEAVAANLSDPFRDALTDALGATTQSAAIAAVDACEGYVEAGHVLALDGCLVVAQSVPGADGDEDAVLGVLDLFFTDSRVRLSLQ